MRFGIANRVGTKRRWVVQEIGRIERSRFAVPEPDLPRSMSGKMDDLQSETPNLQDFAVLDSAVDFYREVPILPDDRRIREAETLAWLQIKIRQQLFRGKTETRDIFRSGDHERIFDNRPIQGMTDSLSSIPGFQGRS